MQVLRHEMKDQVVEQNFKAATQQRIHILPQTDVLPGYKLSATVARARLQKDYA